MVVHSQHRKGVGIFTAISFTFKKDPILCLVTVHSKNAVDWISKNIVIRKATLRMCFIIQTNLCLSIVLLLLIQNFVFNISGVIFSLKEKSIIIFFLQNVLFSL